MGLSSSSSTQQSSGTQNQTQNATTTPNAPSWLTSGLENYVSGIGNFGNADPNSFVAPASPLQSQAFDNASNLGQWTGNSNAASNIALGAANAGAKLMPGSAGYSAAQGGTSTYDPAQLASPMSASGTGYTAGQQGGVSFAPTTNANATSANAASLLDGLGNYMSPYTNDVVNSTLADYDKNAGEQQAALEAKGAASGAFGGSRFGIEQGQLTGDLARGRATTESNLLNQSFNTAAGLSQADAANRQQASLFNANAANSASSQNASAANQAALSQAGIDNQIGAANTAAQNAAAQYGAGAMNNASLANQAAGNQFALAQAQAQDAAGQFNAGSANQNMQAYLAAQDAASQYGAQSQNQMEQFNAQAQEAALQRQLAASGQLNTIGNNYATNTQNDLATMNNLGTNQRSIEQAYDLAPLAQLQAVGSLFGATPYQALVGQTVNGTTNGTTSGTTNTVTQPSLFNQLLAAGSTAAGFF